MLNRRHIRVKVMQSIYAMHSHQSDQLDKEEVSFTKVAEDRGLTQTDIDLGDIEIFDFKHPDNAGLLAEFAELFYEKRKRRGFTKWEAEKQVRKSNYFAAMMLETNRADGVISGLTKNYPDAIRPALQIIGKKPGVTKVAGMYLLLSKQGPLFFSDTTINFSPSVADVVEITELTSEAVERFNLKPKIAMLSYSNFGSADGCPQTYGTDLTCNNGWTIDDVLWVSSHGGGNVLAMPQIHTKSGSQARQWAVLAARAADMGMPLRLAAITVQTAACSQVRSGCPTTGVSAWDGWSQLRRAIDAIPKAVGTKVGAPMDIRWGWANGFVIPPETTTTTSTTTLPPVTTTVPPVTTTVPSVTTTITPTP